METLVTSVSPLSKEGKTKIEAMLENYPIEGGIQKVITYTNFDASDEEELPGGLVSIHPVGAQLHVDSIPEKSFSYLMVCPIVNSPVGELTDANFTSKEELLNAAVPQYSDRPPSMYNRASNNTDMNTWNAELGDEGFAGIFKKVTEHGRSADYFIVAQAGVSNASAEFKDYLSKHEGMTFEQMLNDPNFGYIKHLAQRNTARIAYNVARAYKVPIHHTADISSYCEKDWHAQPMKSVAKNGYQQAQSTINVLPQGYEGKDAVAIYHNVRPVQEASQICFVTASPYDGIAIFHMKGNGVGIGLPANTGKTEKYSTLPEMDPKVAKQRAKGLVWDSLKTNPTHPDLHPEAFRRVDAEFLNQMKSMGWKQEGLDNREYLVPVAVKITHPDVKRTVY